MDSFEGQQFVLNFSDLTILEFDGEYEEIKKSMEEESYVGCEWMLRSDATVDFPTNSCFFTLHFYHNKDVYIVDYQSSVSDVFYNSDIPCLSMWVQYKGWSCPKPHPDLIREEMGFWKHFWETRIVDSDYLDKRYGERIIDFSDYIDEDEE